MPTSFSELPTPEIRGLFTLKIPQLKESARLANVDELKVVHAPNLKILQTVSSGICFICCENVEKWKWLTENIAKNFTCCDTGKICELRNIYSPLLLFLNTSSGCFLWVILWVRKSVLCWKLPKGNLFLLYAHSAQFWSAESIFWSIEPLKLSFNLNSTTII